MKKLLFAIFLSSLSSCVNKRATVAYCSEGPNQVPEKKVYALKVTANLRTKNGDVSKTVPMTCTYKDKFCMNREWFFRWHGTLEKELIFQLGKAKYLSIEAPSCSLALDYLGKKYPFGESQIVWHGEKFSISNGVLSMVGSISLYGARLRSLIVSEEVNE